MIINYIQKFNEILNAVEVTENKSIVKFDHSIEKIADKLNEVRNEGASIYLIGNGGSNGIVSHTSVDLINTCKIKAVPLSEAGAITCFANDFGYENVFSKPLEVFISPLDILIAVSSSGESKNIINSVEIAKRKKAFLITLSGFKADNCLREKGDFNFWLNSDDYGLVEIGHAFLLHYLTDYYSGKYIKKTL